MMMMKILLAGVVIVSIVLTGCSSTTEIKKEEPAAAPIVKKPPAPDMKITVASLNLSNVSKRFEKEDIRWLTAFLKTHNVDIFAVQGITRYPELKTRLDIVQEIAASTEMRLAFGENINLSGRQTGNAVFTVYPLHAQLNTPYEGIASKGFESALQAVVDCGVRDVVVVSTRLPEKASVEDRTTCIKTLSSFKSYYSENPLIIAGNLPNSELLRAMTKFNSIKDPDVNDAPRIWYSSDGSLTLLRQSIEESPLSPIVVVEFGVFHKPRP